MARTARTVLQAGASTLVALVLMGGLGLARAYADPTPTPEPEVTAASTPAADDPSTETPTPTPALETAATPTAAPTLTAGPTSTAAVPVRTEQDARVPNAVQPPEGHINVVPNPEDFTDDRFRIDVITRCLDDVPVEITITSGVSQATTLDYLISNDILVNITDSVTIPPAPGSATITVPQTPSGTVYGDLRIELFDEGQTQPFAIQHFDIIYCLGVLVECQTISWENDDEIPVTLVYGEGERLGADPADAITAVLQGGFTDRIVRTDWGSFYWYAETVLDGAGDNVVIERAGEGSGITVPQDCEPDPFGQVGARCTPEGGETIFAAYIEHRDGDSYRYVVTNTDGDVVASRTVPADGTAQAQWEDPLPGVGTYRYRLYLNGSGTAVETHVFEAQFCLVVTKSCQLISFFNPPTNDAVSVVYYIINEDPSGDFVLQPGASHHISWASFGDMFALRWSGRTAAGDSGGGGVVSDVPMDCTPSPLPSPTSTSPPPDPGPGDGVVDDGLADTGASAGLGLGLGTGLLLVVAASILLGRRRLSL
jgi:hypothetical protein